MSGFKKGYAAGIGSVVIGFGVFILGAVFGSHEQLDNVRRKLDRRPEADMSLDAVTIDKFCADAKIW